MRHLPLEISIYRDGVLLSAIYFHTSSPAAGFVELFRLPVLTGDTRDELNLEIMWDGEPMAGWLAFRASLFDNTRSPLVPTQRPGLLYAGPTDCPSVTVMQATWRDASAYALCLRSGTRYEAPAQPAGGA